MIEQKSARPKQSVRLAKSLFGYMLFASIVSGSQCAAQVPGVPSTQPSAAAQTPAAGTTVLSGRVKSDMATAERLLSQGKWSEAEGLFREGLVNNPTDSQATLGLGLALANQFKLDAADALFDRVIKIDPNNPGAYAGKSVVTLNRLQSSSGTVIANRDSILKQAEDYAQRAVQLGPANAEAHMALGQALKEEGKLDEAVNELNTATRFDPQLSYAFSSVGSVKLQQNSLAEAAASFTQAVNLNSANSTAHYGLGATLLKQGQVDDAIKELNTSLYQFPNSWPTRMALGDAYAKQGNVVAALQQYQLSTLIKPENADPYLAMADIHQQRGDLELAIADLRSGLSQSPYDINLRQRIADINLQLERADEAIKGYRTILEMSANDNAAVKGLSQALYLKAQKATVGAMLQSNDYDAANKALDEAIKLNPNDMELRLAKEKLASLSGATVDFTNMPAPTNDGDRVAYAEAAMGAGNFQKSVEQLNIVVQNQTDAKQTYAVADIAVMVRALDVAQNAYNRGLSQGGSPDRGQRGLKQVAQLKQQAKEATAVANELAKKKQWDGAMAKYREALKANPMFADARYGMAEALDQGPKDSVPSLIEFEKK
ncbi:MAG: tetratricopeptide repeat protein, partial [Cyanobacteria bacterium SZAS LIN-2]|nr:tetratricopeptide repeat protein [Cyanobacteria bacterium SZAS LIN-2]